MEICSASPGLGTLFKSFRHTGPILKCLLVGTKHTYLLTDTENFWQKKMNMSDKKRSPSFLCSQILLNEQSTSVLKWWGILCFCSLKTNHQSNATTFLLASKTTARAVRKLRECYWFAQTKMNGFWLLTVVQNYNTTVICYTTLSVRFLHFTKHGK